MLVQIRFYPMENGYAGQLLAKRTMLLPDKGAETTTELGIEGLRIIIEVVTGGASPTWQFYPYNVDVDKTKPAAKPEAMIENTRKIRP